MSARTISVGILTVLLGACIIAVSVSNHGAKSPDEATPTMLDASTTDTALPSPTELMDTPESYYLPEGTETVTSAGKTGLWIAFGCMAVPCIYFWYMARSKPRGQRKFEYLSFTINAIASLAYLTMAMGYGATAVNGQQFFYARYVDWTLTTPLMLLDLILLAHGNDAESEEIAHILAIDVLMVVGGLVGALQGGHNSAWAFFTFSMFFFIPIFYYLLFSADFQEKIQPAYAAVYSKAAWLTAIFWCGYPIAWVLHEGTNTIDLDTAVIIYLILDTISKSVWGFIITMGRDSVTEDDPAGRPLQGGQ